MNWRKVLTYLLLILFALFFLFPIIFMFVGSFKPDTRVLSDQTSWRAFVPIPFTKSNYPDAQAHAEFWTLFRNSVVITTPTVIGGLFVNSLFGYALARLRFRGRRFLLTMVVALVIVPFQAIAIPLFFLVAKFGWLDTYHVQILPFLASPFFIYMFYTFFLALPRELEEAAYMDGARPLRTFFQIIAPLARPGYATVAILSFLFSWGELLWPVLVTRGTDVRPLPLGLANFQTLQPLQWGDIMAFATLFTLPLLIVFLVFQRQFVRGVAATGVRG